jgi:pyrroloquinoline quinone biosynthesis protein E
MIAESDSSLASSSKLVSGASKYRPFLLLAELTYQCPLHCPYCSNPSVYPNGTELSTAEWLRVMGEAAKLGVFHVGFSGGEPLLRDDLVELVSGARAAGLYTNLITSGLGLKAARAEKLRAAGLDSAQLSFQADVATLGDSIARTRAHAHKLEAARAILEAGLPLSVNVVLHRANIDRLPQIIEFALGLGASRIELANVQYYGWAYANRGKLLPTREQVQRAVEAAQRAKKELDGRMEIFYVLPDYYQDRPKPCMDGWGRRYLTVNPTGQVLPCPTASGIPGMRFDNVREKSLAWIWNESESFNHFRGVAWMPEPCQSCPQRDADFGGCRCQAALLTGDASATDPVCALSPNRRIVDKILEEINSGGGSADWDYRQNPKAAI